MNLEKYILVGLVLLLTLKLQDSLLFGVIILLILWKFYFSKKYKIIPYNEESMDNTKETNLVNEPEFSNSIYQDDDEIYSDSELDNILQNDVLPNNLSEYMHDGSYEDIDVDVDELHDIQKVHKHMGCEADNALFNRMKYVGIQNQVSQVNRASYNKYNLYPWLKNELKENETRDWWDSDYLETQF